MKKSILLSLLVMLPFPFTYGMEKNNIVQIDPEASENGSTQVSANIYQLPELDLTEYDNLEEIDYLLFKAIKYRNSFDLRELISQGAHVNCADINGVTPLMLAIEEYFVDGINFLINHGADINQKDKKGWSSLAYAVHRENLGLVNELITRGAELGGVSSDDSLLLLATSYKMTKLLLEHGIQVRNSKPINRAIQFKFDDVIQLLIAHDININLQDDSGKTGLMIATRENRNEIVRLLLKHNANPKIKDNDGHTVLYYALNNANLELIKLFLSLGLEIDYVELKEVLINKITMSFLPSGMEKFEKIIKIVTILYPIVPQALYETLNAVFQYAITQNPNLEAIKILANNGFDFCATWPKNSQSEEINSLVSGGLMHLYLSHDNYFEKSQEVVLHLLNKCSKISGEIFQQAYENFARAFVQILSANKISSISSQVSILKTHATNLLDCAQKLENSDVSGSPIFLTKMMRLLELSVNNPVEIKKLLLLKTVYELIEKYIKFDPSIVRDSIDVYMPFIEQLFNFLNKDQPELCKERLIELLDVILEEVFKNIDLNNNQCQKLIDQLNKYSEILRQIKKEQHSQAFKLDYLQDRESGTKRQKRA